MFDDEKHQRTIKYFDAKGRLTSSKIHKYYEDGSERTDFFDAKGKLTEYEVEKVNNESSVWTTYTPDGKLVKQSNSAYGQGKYVEIVPDRSLLHKLLDLPQGGTMGDVAKVSVSKERAKTNSKLKFILKSAISPEEKKLATQKAVAEYRATNAKAPNPKVHKKLMDIHQAEK